MQQQSLTERLQRLARTPDDLRDAVRGHEGPALSRRASPEVWSATDVICHLRDIEELVIVRFHMMLAMDEPRVLVVGAAPVDPATWGFDESVPYPMDADRWRDERQYERNDAATAVSAFARRRTEVLTLLGRLSPEQRERGAVHPSGQRWAYADWTAGMVRHDDAHLEQLRRALAG